MKLEEVPIPTGVEERSWRTIREAYEARIPNPRRRTATPSLPITIAAAIGALAIAAAALSASGDGVLNTVRDALGVRNAATTLTRLPAGGRLLVNTSAGAWIVDSDGARRYLGDSGYTNAGWSPHGLYEIAVRRTNELVAVDPKGKLRWSLARGRISDPRWSDDGYRIAYRSGTSLRVVAGDGTDDRLIATRTAAAEPAWVGTTHHLAYADLQGRIHLINTDTGRSLWIARRGPLPTSITWEPERDQLLVVTAGNLRTLRARDGRLLKEIPIRPGRHVLAVSPAGQVAITTSTATGQGLIALLDPAQPAASTRPVFHGSGEFNSLAWSPDGRWLLASWASADQWVFIKLNPRSGAVERVQAVSSIARQFHAGKPPTLGGWCCASNALRNP